MHESTPSHRVFSFWRFNLCIWAVLALAEFTIRIAFLQDTSRAVRLTLLMEPLGFFISSMIYLVYRKPDLCDPFGFRTAVWMVLLSFAAGLLQAAISLVIIAWAGWWTSGWTQREEWLLRITFMTFIYLTWSLVYFGLRIRAKARSEEERAKKATEEAQRMELQLLRSQLDPHFLFNSLNGISAEIPAHPNTALQMVHELSDYLRYSLEQRHRMASPLSTELDAMTAYLRIEQARYGDRLKVNLKADPAARRKTVPSFLLQPMIENAVKHGFQQDLTSWELNISAWLEQDLLVIEVRHFGRLGAEIREGVGLETLRRRLELHYPKRNRFTLEQNGEEIRARLELEGDPCFA